ncbi:MAG: hemolysin family protein [candidate division WOR-3 bacterium]
MPLGIIFRIIFIVIFLILSFIFSGYETAFFTLRPADIERLRAKKRDWVKGLKKSETELLGTILIANLLANILASSLISSLSLNFFSLFPHREFSLFLLSLLTAIFIFLFCEATPKIYSFANRDWFLRLSPLLIFLKRIFSPIFFLFSQKIDDLVKRKRRGDFPTTQELADLIQVAEKEGILDSEEKDILLALKDMEKMTLKSFLTPKRKIFALDCQTKIGEAIKIAKTIPYSRIPLYQEKIENIVGILYVKDLVVEHLSPERREDLPVKEIMRPVSFLPEGQNALEGLEILRKKGTHLAVVVDEFGEISGIITLEDILEGLFGEIRDEYDLSEEETFRQIDERTYLVLGEIDMKTLNRLLADAFAEVSEERLSGFIARSLKRLPEKGDSFIYRNIQIEVLEVIDKRVEKVLLRIL